MYMVNNIIEITANVRGHKARPEGAGSHINGRTAKGA